MEKPSTPSSIPRKKLPESSSWPCEPPREGRGLTLIVKSGGLPAISELCKDVFDECVRGKSLPTRILDADNATYQILASACEFDVIVSPNLFGHILSDATALILGSRGLSFSGNFSESGVAVYQTGHGAAHNIAGDDIANPIGHILAAAMMLRESFGMLEEADPRIAMALMELLRVAGAIPGLANLVFGDTESRTACATKSFTKLSIRMM
jgi:isocitrate/isopropylmalate dehydrogenase